MPEHEAIIEYARAFVPFTDEEAAEFAGAFTNRHIKKRQFLIQPGFVDRYKYFVIKGAIRAYVIDNEGMERTVQLAIDQWWISDYNSYLTQEPASMFVIAMEDCDILQISFGDEQRLKAANHKFETFFRMMAEKGVAFMQRRFISANTHSAEERYNLFMDRYPQMMTRFPQFVIASYLGMTTQFLSKIRSQKAKS